MRLSRGKKPLLQIAYDQFFHSQENIGENVENKKEIKNKNENGNETNSYEVK